MHIIPVLDLMQGHAVLAQGGNRADYRPLCTPLSPSSEPCAVIDAFLTLYSFTTLYIADLDAIMQQGGHNDLLLRLHASYPGLTFWVDQGGQSTQRLLGKHSMQRWIPVIGSESLTEETLPLLRQQRQDYVLSLDFRGEQRLGPVALWQTPKIWPERVIVLNLARVGSRQGPDWQRLLAFRHDHPSIRCYAGGGVRHDEDLRRLAAAGIEGALAASALHQRVFDGNACKRLAEIL